MGIVYNSYSLPLLGDKAAVNFSQECRLLCFVYIQYRLNIDNCLDVIYMNNLDNYLDDIR